MVVSRDMGRSSSLEEWASVSVDISDYWTNEEQSWDIATKEATALKRVLLAFQNQLRNSRVDDLVDNQAVVQAWNNQSGKSGPLNE